MHVERFAPSPTGRLHLGHAFSALTAWDAAQAASGVFRLRIEDLDQTRARPEFEAGIVEDLEWLGLNWPRPVLRQSVRAAAYSAALETLTEAGLTYRCGCSRRDILAASDAPQEGGPDGPVYPGTCRSLVSPPQAPFAIRINMAKAVARAGPLDYFEIGAGRVGVDADWLVEKAGDIVLARKDAAASYHLAVVVDDAHEAVTHVTRGEDLRSATPVHRLLQALLGLPSPVYRHHRLIRDETGRRLAKRHDDLALATLRERGWTVSDVRRAVGL